MKALLTNYHQSPRKVRLVANLIRGKSVPAARAALLYLPKKSSPALSKLLDSAIANARNAGANVENLFIKKITVDKGAVMRRARPFARGRSGSIRKEMSIVFLELGTTVKEQKTKNKKQIAKKPKKI
ncbi:MAG: 50S ribosomal protein L22 [Candidatus Kaiserbacteria bacterium GW2011_GWB1_52_6]|uniref:Large ribosomal subunit protein uL22 n=3 Tax=Candidatus Kaiseribacteriota TaxID=1752734 RepID=A0A0G1XMB7_9BACT|nr:MAG: 50S ribosomal protein L22 [Candidatus Kaiserbacteria bacterium GW2011_GWA2_52_12]KKW26243.1 MAG: 50S ribosomal protein L22 [Candidatus Kaiserbacteria bacterium GW2011_GWB1_52_6]KKW32051.1 MAG: 50S ribosomal protein L22 [Candidatus Kaiserbacteria bacterium GW2011_GWC2_52_8b]